MTEDIPLGEGLRHDSRNSPRPLLSSFDIVADRFGSMAG